MDTMTVFRIRVVLVNIVSSSFDGLRTTPSYVEGS
jgi:hypothetical protein